MGPTAFLCRLCARSAARPRTTTALGANLRTFRSRGYRSSHWRWSEQPRRQRYARVTLFAAGNSAVLGTLAFVDLPTTDATDGEATWESRLLEASRNELKAARDDRARNEPNKLIKLIYGAIAVFDKYLWEPICTTTRFLHLAVIFVPVILGVPAMWIGQRQPDNDNERSGTLWWYGFLVQAMEWAGPAFIKLGQWAASRTDIFPTQMCEVMSKLHSNAPAHSMRDTRRIIEAAFGGLKFDDIFSEFDETPLGVGAIAQVYKGKLRPDLRLPSDTDIEAEEPSNLRKNVAQKVQSALKSTPQRVPSQSVAVKVLHPGVERTVRRDLRIMGFFAEVLNVIPSMEWLSLPDEVAQFGDMMKLQLDLRIEAANLARFRKNFKDRTTAWFPYPYPELTTRSVLVEEFANGMPLSAFLEFGGGVFQASIADEGLDAFLRMVLLDNFIHADLHPGNIMVRFYQRSHPEMPRLMKPTDELRSGDDVTDLVISRLEPHRRNGDADGWVSELEKIEVEGYRPQLIFIDTGLVTELNATNRQNFLDLFRAVAEFDGYKAGHLMCERCRQPEAVIDKEVFALKMQHLVLAVKGRTLALGNIKLGDILQRVLAMVRNHHVRLEGDFVNVVISILLLEGIGRNLNPDADLLRSSLPILRQLSARGGAEMAKSGDFSMILVWMGLETRRFLQASVEDVERLVKYDLLAPNV